MTSAQLKAIEENLAESRAARTVKVYNEAGEYLRTERAR